GSGRGDDRSQLAPALAEPRLAFAREELECTSTAWHQGRRVAQHHAQNESEPQ
ncbi:unnamed protein product, partial [Symbiodinium sp. CCMP2456]